jgi:predicted nucleic-acid-binding protein
MIGLDINILARYYIEDAADAESVSQRELARHIIEAGKPLMVCKTVLLEFEWIMRGYYEFERRQVAKVMQHLLSLTHVSFEDRDAVEHAMASYLAGLDFADALHHASYRTCKSMLTFDDRKFVRRAKRLALVPNVSVPKPT